MFSNIDWHYVEETGWCFSKVFLLECSDLQLGFHEMFCLTIPKNNYRKPAAVFVSEEGALNCQNVYKM